VGGGIVGVAADCTGGENEVQSITGCADETSESSGSEVGKSEERKTGTGCDMDEPGPGVENGRMLGECKLLFNTEEVFLDVVRFNSEDRGGNVESGA
jgi:hypothetical protein